MAVAASRGGMATHCTSQAAFAARRIASAVAELCRHDAVVMLRDDADRSVAPANARPVDFKLHVQYAASLLDPRR